MTIYQMTATFGKLENQTLTLRPGLQVIHAPNEWGKSTWCAFLLAMLYGIDTREKTTKNALADKERYAPWSGSPMAGRIDLNWQGRDITIERATRRRVPLGEFRAYETATGIPVPELTAANCGQKLLGVEQSVFRRTGFIRLTDLPVTQDEALRSRLNALVTTADESGSAQQLQEQLKDLKNRIRYNRTGLLPRLEAEKAQLQQKLRDIRELEAASADLQEQLANLEAGQKALENHAQWLRYRESLEHRTQLEEALLAQQEAAAQIARLEQELSESCTREQAAQALLELDEIRSQREAALNQLEFLELEPSRTPPEKPLEPARLLEDTKLAARLKKSRMLPLWLMAAFLTLAGAGCGWFGYRIPALAAAGAALVLLMIGLILSVSRSRKRKALTARYGCLDPRQWLQQQRTAQEELDRYREAALSARQRRKTAEDTLAELRQREEALQPPVQEPPQSYYNRILQQHGQLDAARREAERCAQFREAVAQLAKPSPKPEQPDALETDAPTTQTILMNNRQRQSQLHRQLGELQGQMQNLGAPDAIAQRIQTVTQRTEKLEAYYSAATLAQQALQQAQQELQRRFAPRITRRAAELLSKLTQGRYTRLTMDPDFGLHAATEDEPTLHSALWRSDGTTDQLYLALRLAVAEALHPETPLILDDALVRFDDVRLEAALALLQELGQQRQILLFSCQERETRILSGK